MTRITSEFLEMPGLTLTAAQASRLLGIQHADCLRLLDALVGAGFLRRSVRGHYVRAGER